MKSSGLSRRLLYCGQSEMNDFLKDSPLNRFLYEKLLGVFSASGIDVPAVVLFNEIYYQCVRVNYDGMPGMDVGGRYWSEEEAWIESSDGAQLVFCAVWALLSVKRGKNFLEKCFLGALAPYLRNSAFGPFADELARELRLSKISVPSRFPVMTCPVSEVVAAFTLTTEQRKAFWGYEDPALIITEDSWRRTWKEVTCCYSHSIIERYLQLYSDPDDQLELISCMKAPLYPKKHAKWLEDLEDLSQRISTGCFDPEEPALWQQTASSEMEAEDSDEPLFDLGLDGTGKSKNLDLAMHYREERDALQLQVEEMRKSHAMELAKLEAEYKAEIELLQAENEKFIRWPSRKRVGKLPQSGQGPDVLVFNLNDVVAHVKERFSRSGGEEICAMLYRFAVEYGNLSKETIEQIDSIMPAIIYRDLPHQTFKFPHVTQFNNNPGKVVNEA